MKWWTWLVLAAGITVAGAIAWFAFAYAGVDCEEPENRTKPICVQAGGRR